MQSITVHIAGVEYKLLGENPNIIYNAASIVNDKMLQIGEKLVVESSTTNAVLTALNLAEERLELQKKIEDEEKLIKSKLDELNGILVSVLAL